MHIWQAIGIVLQLGLIWSQQLNSAYKLLDSFIYLAPPVYRYIRTHVDIYTYEEYVHALYARALFPP